jgi:hypothetical protein
MRGGYIGRWVWCLLEEKYETVYDKQEKILKKKEEMKDQGRN